MVYLMFGHAVTSGALFLGVGLLYDRYKTRLIFYYGSLVILCLFFLFYILYYFIEFWFSRFFKFCRWIFDFIRSFWFFYVIVFLSSLGMVLSLMYSLFLYIVFFSVLYRKHLFVFIVIVLVWNLLFYYFCFFCFNYGFIPWICNVWFMSSILSFEVIRF